MKKVVLRTPMRTRSNSFSDAFFVRTFPSGQIDHHGVNFTDLLDELGNSKKKKIHKFLHQ
jgi:hypothetical protein